MEMAVKEGWYGKAGSKWQTMEEVMLRYRTASFFGKLYAPELLMGMQSVEEAQDTTFSLQPDGTVDVPGKPVVAMPRAKAPEPEDAQPPARQTVVDQSTGEINPPPAAAKVIAPADAPDVGAISQPATEPPKPRAPSDPRALATEGERKFLLNRAKAAGLEVAQLMAQAGVNGLPADLAGLTKDGFIALRDVLPKSP